ncbi:hypothetical protein GCM10022254_11560 [Actinomadura meridiana]|uniref:Uncharacterized protein n=1 Tax=Actinomadura meridiana TaxID=559626 RepID=A0ABP8BV17_9ACTN
MSQQGAVGVGEFLLGESGEQEALHPRGFPDEVGDIDGGLRSGGVADADQDSPALECAECRSGEVAAQAVEDDVRSCAVRQPRDPGAERFLLQVNHREVASSWGWPGGTAASSRHVPSRVVP